MILIYLLIRIIVHLEFFKIKAAIIIDVEFWKQVTFDFVEA